MKNKLLLIIILQFFVWGNLNLWALAVDYNIRMQGSDGFFSRKDIRLDDKIQNLLLEINKILEKEFLEKKDYFNVKSACKNLLTWFKDKENSSEKLDLTIVKDLTIVLFEFFLRDIENNKNNYDINEKFSDYHEKITAELLAFLVRAYGFKFPSVAQKYKKILAAQITQKKHNIFVLSNISFVLKELWSKEDRNFFYKNKYLKKKKDDFTIKDIVILGKLFRKPINDIYLQNFLKKMNDILKLAYMGHDSFLYYQKYVTIIDAIGWIIESNKHTDLSDTFIKDLVYLFRKYKKYKFKNKKQRSYLLAKLVWVLGRIYKYRGDTLENTPFKAELIEDFVAILHEDEKEQDRLKLIPNTLQAIERNLRCKNVARENKNKFFNYKNLFLLGKFLKTDDEVFREDLLGLLKVIFEKPEKGLWLDIKDKHFFKWVLYVTKKLLKIRKQGNFKSWIILGNISANYGNVILKSRCKSEIIKALLEDLRRDDIWAYEQHNILSFLLKFNIDILPKELKEEIEVIVRKRLKNSNLMVQGVALLVWMEYYHEKYPKDIDLDEKMNYLLSDHKVFCRICVLLDSVYFDIKNNELKNKLINVLAKNALKFSELGFENSDRSFGRFLAELLRRKGALVLQTTNIESFIELLDIDYLVVKKRVLTLLRKQMNLLSIDQLRIIEEKIAVWPQSGVVSGALRSFRNNSDIYQKTLGLDRKNIQKNIAELSLNDFYEMFNLLNDIWDWLDEQTRKDVLKGLIAGSSKYDRTDISKAFQCFLRDKILEKDKINQMDKELLVEIIELLTLENSKLVEVVAILLGGNLDRCDLEMIQDVKNKVIMLKGKGVDKTVSIVLESIDVYRLVFGQRNIRGSISGLDYEKFDRFIHLLPSYWPRFSRKLRIDVVKGIVDKCLGRNDWKGVFGSKNSSGNGETVKIASRAAAFFSKTLINDCDDIINDVLDDFIKMLNNKRFSRKRAVMSLLEKKLDEIHIKNIKKIKKTVTLKNGLKTKIDVYIENSEVLLSLRRKKYFLFPSPYVLYGIVGFLSHKTRLEWQDYDLETDVNVCHSNLVKTLSSNNQSDFIEVCSYIFTGEIISKTTKKFILEVDLKQTEMGIEYENDIDIEFDSLLKVLFNKNYDLKVIIDDFEKLQTHLLAMNHDLILSEKQLEHVWDLIEVLKRIKKHKEFLQNNLTINNNSVSYLEQLKTLSKLSDLETKNIAGILWQEFSKDMNALLNSA